MKLSMYILSSSNVKGHLQKKFHVDLEHFQMSDAPFKGFILA